MRGGALWLAVWLAASGCAEGGRGDTDAGAPAPVSGTPPPGRTVVDPEGPIAAGRDAGPTCDILRQNCGRGEGCYRGGCAPAGAATLRAPCRVDSDCVPGLLCAPYAGGAACARACHLERHDQYCEEHCEPAGPPQVGYCRL